MSKPSQFPRWLLGGAITWLVYVITLSSLHLFLLEQWGVPFTIKIYRLSATEPISPTHALLVAMIFPAIFFLDVLSFLKIHSPWLDAAIFNWGRLTLLSSIPAFVTGALIFARDQRLRLAGAILGLLLLGGSLLFVMSSFYSQ